MTAYLPRSAWGARAPRGSTALVASQVLGTALHWPGMAKPIDAAGDIGKRRVASALRGWQNYHMDTRGWSDIAYQIAVDQAGRAWTLRGLNIRSGANGDATVNRQYGAILLILAPGEKPSAVMLATTRGVIADFRKRFLRGTAIKPHSAVRPEGTDCPGPAARAAITRGDFTPKPVATTGDEMTLEELKAYMRLLYGPDGTEGVWNATINAKLDLIIRNQAEMKATLARIEDDTDDGSALHAQVMQELAEIQAVVAPKP